MGEANLKLFPTVELGARAAVGDGCVSPIGARRVGRRRRSRGYRRLRASTAAAIAELRRVIEAHHHELVEEVCKVRRHQRNVREPARVLQRRVLNLERDIGLVEDPKAPERTRRHPIGA